MEDILKDILAELKTIRIILETQNKTNIELNQQMSEDQEKQKQKIEEMLISLHPGIADLLRRIK